MCAPAEDGGRPTPHPAPRTEREGPVKSRDGARENHEGQAGSAPSAVTPGAEAVDVRGGLRERAAAGLPVAASEGRNGTVA